SEAGGLWGLLEYWVNVRLTQRMVNFLRTDLFEGFTRLSLTTVQDQRVGDSMYRVLYDAPMVPDVVYQLTLRPVAILIGALIQIYLIEYTYGDISPELVWVTWSTFPIVIAITFPFSGLMRRTNQTKRAAGSATTSSMEESMDSIAAVQSLGGMDREKERFAERSEESFLRERYAIVVWAIVTALGGITLTLMLLVWGRGIAHDVIGGTLTPGDFFALIGILFAIFMAAGELGDTWIFVQEPAAALRRVFFFIDQERDEDAHGEEELGTLNEGVTFENLSYEYPDGSAALKEINLELPTNSLVAIVGPTGAGKTSLAYMIPALLRPTRGRVLIDGRDVMEFDLDSLRRQVTYVFQEHLLLSASIRDNLAIANPEATENELTAALQTAGCMDFVTSMPEGIDTVLGRSGETLSVGQQQRLSIARGLIRNSQILILDEPTAALDPIAENRLVDALTEISRDRLVIVIAHRLSTIRRADRIVFMDQGKVLEVGSHESLMLDNNSQYRRYVELQGVDSPEER
ncbi:MAG: ABC transporter ATP-binding protein, partial [Pseudomonadales bacterium]